MANSTRDVRSNYWNTSPSMNDERFNSTSNLASEQRANEQLLHENSARFLAQRLRRHVDVKGEGCGGVVPTTGTEILGHNRPRDQSGAGVTYDVLNACTRWEIPNVDS
jgi:hypothetical protein